MSEASMGTEAHKTTFNLRRLRRTTAKMPRPGIITVRWDKEKGQHVVEIESEARPEIRHDKLTQSQSKH